MNARGQSALEYLMTYGWALVVIVIVIAALFAFGVFSTPKNCSPTGGRMFIKDYTITGGGISLSIQNGGGDTMTNIAVSAAGSGCGTLTSAAGNATTLSRSDTNVFVLTGTCSGNVNVPVTLSYDSGSPALSKTEVTTCTGAV